MTVPSKAPEPDSGRLSIRQADALPGDMTQSLRRLVADHLRSTGAGSVPVPDAAVDRLTRHITSICRQLTQPMTVAFLGPEGSYSYQAAMAYFGPAVQLCSVPSIATVIGDVQGGSVSRGIVPVENSTDGRVVDSLSCLIQSDRVQAVGEVRLAIHHAMISSTARGGDHRGS